MHAPAGGRAPVSPRLTQTPHNRQWASGPSSSLGADGPGPRSSLQLAWICSGAAAASMSHLAMRAAEGGGNARLRGGQAGQGGATASSASSRRACAARCGRWTAGRLRKRWRRWRRLVGVPAPPACRRPHARADAALTVAQLSTGMHVFATLQALQAPSNHVHGGTTTAKSTTASQWGMRAPCARRPTHAAAPLCHPTVADPPAGTAVAVGAAAHSAGTLRTA